MIFVNHDAHASTPFVLKAANNAAVAVDLYIGTRTHDIARKQDGEVHERTHGDVSIHGEENAVG
jgi:hypothetical protein